MPSSYRLRIPRTWRLLCYLSALSAATTSAFTQESLGAHEHGSGQLNLALEGSTLLIELIAPGADIVGFEHAPENDAQKTRLRVAVARLQDGATLFGLPPAAGCRQQEVSVDSPLMEVLEAPASTAGDSHNHDEKEAGHAEFHARYQFACSNPAALTRFSIRYFALFPAAHELAVQMITPRGQAATKLTPANPLLEF